MFISGKNLELVIAMAKKFCEERDFDFENSQLTLNYGECVLLLKNEEREIRLLFNFHKGEVKMTEQI